MAERGRTATPGNLRPHDLVRLDSSHARKVVAADVAMPQWAREVVEAPAGAWAVVRRSGKGFPRVPLGIRGTERSQRWATLAELAGIAEVVRPFEIILRPGQARAGLPVFQVLANIAPILNRLPGIAWGPAGSSAYELVTGVPALRLSSDLDLLLEADRPFDRRTIEHVVANIDEVAAGVRVDVQVETPVGAFALREWLRVGDGGRVALRTAVGPRLVDDPWVAAGGAVS